MRLIDPIVNLAVTGPRPLTRKEQRFLAALGEEFDAADDAVDARGIARREGLVDPWMYPFAAALLEESFTLGARAAIH